MTARLFPQKTPDTKYSARFIQSFRVNVPAGNIDLYKWITAMTDADYTSYSKAHKGMGSFRIGDRFFMKNVENIGIDTIVQNYELKYHAANHVQLYSPNSSAYIMRWFPVTVAVPWELYIEPVSASSSRLFCLIGTDYPYLLLKIAAWVGGFGGLFLNRHLNKEGKAFALDLEEKFKTNNIITMENNTAGLHSFELPEIKEAAAETIFNPLLFTEIYERTLKLQPGAQRQWGKMNIVQMLNHLKIATGSGLKLYKLKNETSFLYHVFIKFIVLRILKRLPKNIGGAEGFKIEMNDALDFDTEKEQVLTMLQEANSSANNNFPHPMFGNMSRAEWGKLVYRHFDHHLRQYGS